MGHETDGRQGLPEQGNASLAEQAGGSLLSHHIGGSPPPRIGSYVVERELGSGGMGTVYLARSRGGRAVAVKVARQELASDPHFRERFRAEVDAARSVGGFHTAPVVDADPTAAVPWLATAYVPGPTLTALLEAEGPMGEERLRQLGAALAEALAAIHGCGLVHRDLKPGNIIMAPDGPRVLDFGIARALESTRLTATGMAFGTPGFLAPEQAQGLEVGAAADVFALGAVLVAAAGGSAFGAGTPMGMMYRSVHEPPDLTAVPDGLRPVAESCLAKEPDQRPTPERLLDLFAPDNAPYSPTSPSPVIPAAPVAPVTPAAPVTPVTPVAAVPPPPSHSPFGAPSNAYLPPLHQAPTENALHVDDASAEADLAFIAVGRDSSLLVDAAGVTLGPTGVETQYGWAEISTVTYAAQGPKHLGVTVHLRNGTAHSCLLAARRRARLQEWLADLPLILECFL
ncbi:serine/threonine-protein kinase [Streptomyces sp. C11-1]|uniref:Serine/threonine-protein kinase n=1 Tax=Streptomyces durocortorensis TaxID=2811104 RepID=A0ABY9VY88_9ACTN|nr:serine/threonine-protein kinase [Streptomyces durocortorensis]WNF28872.1 serine/threonine-protein kinase [Streptomyces durocortorensis]